MKYLKFKYYANSEKNIFKIYNDTIEIVDDNNIKDNLEVNSIIILNDRKYYAYPIEDVSSGGVIGIFICEYKDYKSIVKNANIINYVIGIILKYNFNKYLRKYKLKKINSALYNI